MQGLQPDKLTHEELLRYAYLELNEKGLPKPWAEALIRALEVHLPLPKGTPLTKHKA
jgi:hypothetical protein